MLSALAASLVLTLDPIAQPPAPRGLAQMVVIDPTPQVEAQHSALWVPAGAYGMGLLSGGAAAILVEYHTRNGDGTRNVKPPLLWGSVALLLGTLPGILLGESARIPDNEKARGAVGVLDVAGTAAMIYAVSQILR